MSLEVLHQPAATHENEQFRRLVEIMNTVFEKHEFNGILVGNPFNENYRRFRADAILFYDRGVVIIDLKNYSGQLNLPKGEDEFKKQPWFIEKSSDHQFIEVKAGAHFLNPYLQLVSYRNAFREIVEHNSIFRQKINTSRVCIANIFSGPLELTNQVPGKYPYYKILQEREVGALLYDLNNDNAFDEDIDKAVRSIFPADEYVREYDVNTKIIHKKDIIVGDDAKNTIDTFMQSKSNDILVLASMDIYERDNWAKYLFSIADSYEIPEVHGLCHSNRISRRLLSRGIEATSLYSFIYGGNEATKNNLEDEDEDKDKDDLRPQVLPLRSASWLDERALLIVYDAHLVSRSLSQTDLLRFGSGRLLEDFISFAVPSSQRKIVFIGDPYMLSFGSKDESAINVTNLKKICGTRVIRYYLQPIMDSQESDKDTLRKSLAKSMNEQVFNNLQYSFKDGSIVEVNKDEISTKIREWFSSPFDLEPQNAVLFYKKSDCHQVNLWIKKNCLKNGEKLAPGDLIISNNNVFIPDATGFGIPKRILNGMYFTVLGIRENHREEISLKGVAKPIILSFTKISVKCLSLSGEVLEIWLLDNFLSGEEELSNEEKIAVNIFVQRRIAELKKNKPFTSSEYYQKLISNSAYQELSSDEQSAIETLIHNRIVTKEEKRKVSTTRSARSLLKQFYDEYEDFIRRLAREYDPLVNALYAKYAWALTVHKAVGSDFENVIIKGTRTENDGVKNDSYFRWLYSAISTSTRSFFITQPRYIHPFMDCKISEKDSGISSSKRILIFETYEVPPQFEEIVKLENTSVVAAICELAKNIEAHNYILKEVKTCSDYQTKAVFLTPQKEKEFIINVHNKGAKDKFGVSSITFERNDVADSMIISEAIESVCSLTPMSIRTTQWPEYISEVYLSFVEQMKESRIEIELVSNKDHQINCKATSSKGSAMLRLWYGTSLENNTKGFITNIEFLEISDDDIITEIRKIQTQSDL
jgi:putative helicase